MRALMAQSVVGMMSLLLLQIPVARAAPDHVDLHAVSYTHLDVYKRQACGVG